MNNQFEGKIVLVTGGSRGIGRVISARFADLGATVLINYLQNMKAAEDLKAQLEKAGKKCRLYKANLVHPNEIREMADKIGAEFGKLDILVHNAALGVFKATLGLRANQWDLTMNVNARALLLLAKQCRELMKGGGQIVAVSSLGSRRVIPNYGAIGVSKAALESLVRYLAVEMAEFGIRVNAISAGIIGSDTIKKFPEHEKWLDAALMRTPAGRLGKPEDVADGVVFLASEMSSWIYGNILVVDGGISL